MARIKDTAKYDYDSVPTIDDYIIGTDNEDSLRTKNYRIGDIIALAPGGGGGITLDLIPTDASTNGVESNGIFDSLATKANLTHTHIIGDVTGLQTALDGKAAVSHTHIIGDVTGLQTALDGKAAVSHTHIIGDVTGLQTALDGKAAVSHTHIIGDVTGLQTALDGKAGLFGANTFNGVNTFESRIQAEDGITFEVAPSITSKTGAGTLTLLSNNRYFLKRSTDNFSAELNLNGLTTNRIYTYPDKSITIAGLDDIPALASQVEAEAGTDNTKIMTPLRVEQAISALATVNGSWTPTVVANGTAGYTYSVQTGTYERVGDIVHFEGTIIVSSTTGTPAATSFNISGLPFAPESTQIVPISMYTSSGFTITGATAFQAIIPSDDLIWVTYNTSGGGIPSSVLNNDLDSSFAIYVAGTYITAAP